MECMATRSWDCGIEAPTTHSGSSRPFQRLAGPGRATRPPEAAPPLALLVGSQRCSRADGAGSSRHAGDVSDRPWNYRLFLPSPGSPCFQCHVAFVNSTSILSLVHCSVTRCRGCQIRCLADPSPGDGTSPSSSCSTPRPCITLLLSCCQLSTRSPCIEKPRF